MREPAVVLLYVGWLIIIICVVIIVSRRRVKAMKLAAHNAGLADIRANFLGRVTGSWRGYTVTWRMVGGGRSGPERAIVEIAAEAPARVSVHRRLKFDIEIAPFGPPVVQTALDTEFIVRADDMMLVQRLIADAKITDEMRAGILERLDKLELDGKRVRAMRVARSVTRDQALRAAWQLASVVVEQLGVPPVSG